MLRLALLAAVSALPLMSLSTVSQAQESNLRVCTGGNQGNYFYFGRSLANSVPGTEVIETAGSYDNLRKMTAGECDAAVVQSDAWYVFKKREPTANLDFERVGSLFREYVTLVCSAKSGIKNLGGINSGTPIAIGEVGSGPWVTWQGMVEADKTNGSDAYSGIPTQNIGGMRALNRVIDGVDTSCMLGVYSPGSAFMTRVAEASEGSRTLTLTDVKDRHFDDTTDDRGQSIYQPVTLSNNTYAGFNRWTNTDTIAVQAVFIISTNWINQNSRTYDELSFVFNDVARSVRADKGISE